MAEFSKEYCDIWDQGFPHDFSIESIAKDLHKGNYYPIICEGFGSIAIAKDKWGRTKLAFGSTDDYVWEDYEEFITKQKERANGIE
jgi:hypothetical protein